IDFAELLPSEQNYIHIWALRAEVNNGGFASYFDNSAGDNALDTQASLLSVGSSDVHSMLLDAIVLLDAGGGYSANRADRSEIASQLADDAFAVVNNRFYDTSEDVVGMAFLVVEAEYKSKGMIWFKPGG